MEALLTKKVVLHQRSAGEHKRRNVLHIIKSLGRGGAETLLSETLAWHDKDKYAFHYIYFFPWKNQLVGELQRHGGRVECISVKSTLGIFFKTRALVKYLRENDICMIHCHMPMTGVVARIAGYLARVPVVYTEHNKWERYHKLTYFLNKLTFGIQRVVIAVSGEVKASIAKHYSNQKPEVRVISNGVDTGKYKRKSSGNSAVRNLLGIPAEATVIGTASVFRSQKRLTTWIEVAVEIRKKNPNTYFIIVGDGVLRDEIHGKATELDTAKFIFFPGIQADVKPYYEAMDLFMMCSEFEGLPIALLEAMSMKCIPACTAAGGIPEVVKHNENGLLVPVDKPEQLASEISACINNKELMNHLRQSARDTVVARFEMRTMVDQLEEVYSVVINTKS